ncbi:MAG: universal stress protein [Candidatus Acidiferrales bacterium]
MKILLAIDDSKFSQAAIESVLARRGQAGTEVKVLHVLEPPSLLMGREMAANDPEFEVVWKALQEEAKSLVYKTVEKLRHAGFEVSPALEEGDPKAKILDVAKDWKADLIVIGSHGRTGLGRFLLGSVSENVVRHSHCSVEIVWIPNAA